MIPRGKFGLSRNALVAVIPLLIILVPLGHTVYVEVLAGGAEDDVTFLELPAEPNDGCVRDTSYMRFHHWELLRQVRDEVVRGGVRKEISLTRCRECHPSRERFCNQCHQAVSLEPDCFGCHYYPAVPGDTGEMAFIRRPGPSPSQLRAAAASGSKEVTGR